MSYPTPYANCCTQYSKSLPQLTTTQPPVSSRMRGPIPRSHCSRQCGTHPFPPIALANAGSLPPIALANAGTLPPPYCPRGCGDPSPVPIALANAEPTPSPPLPSPMRNPPLPLPVSSRMRGPTPPCPRRCGDPSCPSVIPANAGTPSHTPPICAIPNPLI